MLKALQKIREEGPPSIQLTAGNDVAYRKKTVGLLFLAVIVLTGTKAWRCVVDGECLPLQGRYHYRERLGTPDCALQKRVTTYRAAFA